MTVLIIFYNHMFVMDMICNFNFVKGSAYGFDFMLPSPPPGLCCRVVYGARGLRLGNFPQISPNERMKLDTVGHKILNLKKQNCSQHHLCSVL